MASDRYRNFASILYPESANENWLDILKDYHISGYISPLHDKDNNDDDTPKKPHYHIMLMFSGKKSEEKAQEIFDSIGAIKCKVVQSAKSYARYLIHADEKDKQHYNPDDVICLGDADYNTYIKNENDELFDIKEIIVLARSLCINNIADFIDVLIDEGYDKMLRYVIKHAYFFQTYISKRKIYNEVNHE